MNLSINQVNKITGGKNELSFKINKKESFAHA